jgi:hypothetical protein
MSEPIKIYIPAKESKSMAVAGKALDVSAKVTKPLTGILMIVAMPAALALQKCIQSLDYLNFMNVKDLPTNVRSILDFTADGNLFGNINPFGGFYKFDDGRSQSTGEVEDIKINEDGEEPVRIIQEITKTVCRTHPILDQQELSCYGWNNTGLYFL